METLLQAVDRYGIAAVVICAFIVGTAYVLRRLFAAETGIFSKIGERHLKHIDKQEELYAKQAQSIAALATTAKKAHDGMAERDERVEKISKRHQSLHIAGLHACDVLEVVAGKLNCLESAKPSIDSIRRELGGKS